MKSLIRKIFNTNIAIDIRNLIKFRPLKISLQHIKSSESISDAFCWRTDNGFTTTFKYSDILGLFYKIKDSSVHFSFYNKENKLIKKLEYKNLNYSNILKIDYELLDGLKDYGVFYVFHKTNNEFDEKTIISNRCYLGYSKNNNLCSFVHGNTYAKSENIARIRVNEKKSSNITKTSLNNKTYKIQNYFKNITKSELFFANPTSTNIYFQINNQKYNLKERQSLLINISNMRSVTINSNCLFLRPTVFNYKGDYIDVYHS